MNASQGVQENIFFGLLANFKKIIHGGVLFRGELQAKSSEMLSTMYDFLKICKQGKEQIHCRTHEIRNILDNPICL